MDDYELAHEYETVNLSAGAAPRRSSSTVPRRRNAWNDQFSVDLLAAIRAVTEDPVSVRS